MGRLDAAYEHSDSPHPDVRLAALAAQQHIVVSHAQLVGCGISGSAITRRVEHGRLHRQFPGVYSVGSARLTREGRWLAAVLASGPGAVLSHLDAAALWGIYDRTAAQIHVTTARRSREGTAGIGLHRVRRLAADQVTAKDAIPVTTVARTLVDLSDLLGRERLTRTLREAEYLRLLGHDALEAAIAGAHGRRQLAALTGAVALHRPGQIVRQELEHRFLELCRRHGLPAPATNVPMIVAGRTRKLDCLWPQQRVVVELDGRGAHRTTFAFEDDRARDAALTAAGYRCLRFTWRRVNEQERAVADELRATLTRATV